MAKTKKVSEMSSDEIKTEVRKAYAKVAQRGNSEERQVVETVQSSCCPPADSPQDQQSQSSCCGPPQSSKVATMAEALGYDVDGIPKEAIESFAGCGNPVALASLNEGEVVLDLGSGAGLDAFVAAKKVGETGKVIGIDMTPEMLESATKSAKKMGYNNVEFRHGDIEALPVDNDSVDVVISNCVINLAPDKQKVFNEAYRVLRPGGRLMVSDIVLEVPLTQAMRDEVANYTGCLGGAILEEEYLQHIRDAGFEDVKVVEKVAVGFSASDKIHARKPMP
jgi:SAM-dependent methyltransferase